jgi:hypothetical protein
MESNLLERKEMSPRRGDPKNKPPASSGLPTWAIALGIGVLVIVGVLVLFNLQTPQTATPATTSSSTVSSGRTKGDPNAKIELIEWSDFQ